MNTAVEHHTYADADQPLVNVEHHRISGATIYRCIQTDCDNEHHFWCTCAR